MFKVNNMFKVNFLVCFFFVVVDFEKVNVFWGMVISWKGL